MNDNKYTRKKTRICTYTKPIPTENISTATICNNTYKNQNPIHHSKECISSI